MASARLEKLRSLLKRVEERRGKPRLHAVAAPRVSMDDEDLPPTMRPAPTPPPARPATAKSPLEDALGDFGSGTPLEVTALAEPINAPRSAPPQGVPGPSAPQRPAPVSPAVRAPTPAPPRAPTPAPAPLAPVVPIQQAPVVASSRVTLEFEKPRLPPVEARAPAGDLSAPTQTIEPAPLASGAAPVRAVSELRAEAPKSFGELLDLSLALRPR
jgi:hypothetical protein